MARKKTSPGRAASAPSAPQRPLNRRGSAEAIEKRRAARLFNDVLGGGRASAGKLDGRTEKRRQRLLRELELGTQAQVGTAGGASHSSPGSASGSARSPRELKPLDVLQRVQQLLDLGEPLASIRKAVKVKKPQPAADGVIDVVERLHKAYSFRPEVYRFVGIGEDVLRSAGVLESERHGDRARRRRPV
jgi:hypothetical protein